MKNNKDMVMRTFVRFGKLGLVKQEGFGEDTFHAPPAPKGFYAMPLKYQEFFLIGCLDKTQPKILNLPKIDKFKNEDGEIDYTKYGQKKKERYDANRKTFVVQIDDVIWHHLTVPNNEIIDRHNDWVKTTVSVWIKAVSKESLKLRTESTAPWNEPNDGKKRHVFGGINSVRKRTGCYSKDHFEVFFDTKVF